jgi:hypothetical protein
VASDLEEKMARDAMVRAIRAVGTRLAVRLRAPRKPPGADFRFGQLKAAMKRDDMMPIECLYELTPPNGQAAILVLGLGLTCDDEVWRLKTVGLS